MDQRVHIAITIMKGDLRRELSLDEVARTVNLTPSYLCRIFKAETGRTPMKWLKHLRMQRAKELLETSLLSVKEIMSSVGINDESHFVRDFEAAFGATPARYRAARVRVPE